MINLWYKGFIYGATVSPHCGIDRALIPLRLRSSFIIAQKRLRRIVTQYVCKQNYPAISRSNVNTGL